MIIESTLPGVLALVNQGQVSEPILRQPTSTAFAIGFAPWGEVGVRKVVTSFPDFQRTFGGHGHAVSYLADFAFIFFNHYGGKQMVIVRAGESPDKATITVNNRVGSPAATFKFDAKHPSLTVDIKVTVADTVGSTAVCDVKIVSVALGITEKYNAVDLRIAATRDTINAKSKLVDVSLATTIVAGATGRPAAGTFTLASGDDGSAGMSASDMAAFLSQFEDENLGSGQVAIPGMYDTANSAALIAHAERYNRLALLEPDLATEYADVADDFNAAPSSYAAVYFPWVQALDVAGSGEKKFYPPVCFAAGACALVDRTIGTHKAPANYRIPNALDLERNTDGTSVIDDNVREFLNGKNINVIAQFQGQGIKIYGARVLAPTGETRIQFVHERRVLNMCYYSAKLGYAWAPFQVVDPAGRFFRDLVASGKTFLRGIFRDGALYGKNEQAAFAVVADASNNPADELEQGRVHVQWAIHLSPTAEMIIVNIDNVPLSQDLNVLSGGTN